MFQERLLTKYDHQENEAPVIVQRINEEANALREQLRRTKERYESKCEKLHSTSEELDRTQRLLKKMKSLVDDKKLAERDELSRKLTKAQQDIEVKDVTIRVSLTISVSISVCIKTTTSELSSAMSNNHYQFLQFCI